MGKDWRGRDIVSGWVFWLIPGVAVFVFLVWFNLNGPDGDWRILVFPAAWFGLAVSWSIASLIVDGKQDWREWWSNVGANFALLMFFGTVTVLLFSALDATQKYLPG